jgi:hypothetical protein
MTYAQPASFPNVTPSQPRPSLSRVLGNFLNGKTVPMYELISAQDAAMQHGLTGDERTKVRGAIREILRDGTIEQGYRNIAVSLVGKLRMGELTNELLVLAENRDFDAEFNAKIRTALAGVIGGED